MKFPAICAMCAEPAVTFAKPAGYGEWIGWCSRECRRAWLERPEVG